MMDPTFVLAPMDGMSHAAFRKICFDYGADGATTEMVSAISYGRAKKKTSAFDEVLSRMPGEGPLAVQLIGSVPEDMAASAQRLTALNRFEAIDINMGCPARKVVGSGNGSAILQNPDLAREIMAAVKENTDLPVRLKMRLGWDENHIVAPEIAMEAENLGFESVTVHGRTRAQMYKGEVNIEAIRNVCQSVSIPVFANGGVTCARDALSFLEETGAAGVCIGRAALKQPWIFDDIRRLRKGEEPGKRDAYERIGVLKQLAEMLCRIRPEKFSIFEMRKFSYWMLPGLLFADEALTGIYKTETLKGFEGELDAYLNRLTRIGDTCIHPELMPEPTLDTVQNPDR